jgi:hypothetical protein
MSTAYGPQLPTRAVDTRIAQATARAAAHREPATPAEVWAAVRGEVTGDETRPVIASCLAPGPQPQYDTPHARAEALADREAGS